jgi:putative oxidoreductase
MSRTRTILLRVAIVLGVLAYGVAGSAKLLGARMEAQTFMRFGLPLWFMTFIGLCEVAGAIGLLIRRLATWAALGLMIVMTGAIVSHLRFDSVAAALPAAVLFVLMGYVAWQRRADGVGLGRRFASPPH